MVEGADTQELATNEVGSQGRSPVLLREVAGQTARISAVKWPAIPYQENRLRERNAMGTGFVARWNCARLRSNF